MWLVSGRTGVFFRTSCGMICRMASGGLGVGVRRCGRYIAVSGFVLFVPQPGEWLIIGRGR